MKRDSQTKKRDNDRLRQHFDGDDPFFQGNGIKGVREGGRKPEPWMLDRAALKEFLSKRFPRANEHCDLCTRNPEGCSGVEGFMCEYHDYFCLCRSCRQFSRAAMWAYVIQQCFRRGLSAETAAIHWNTDHDADHEEDSQNSVEPVTADYCRRVIQQIELARQGRRLDGKPRSYGRPGRPTGACHRATPAKAS